MVLITLAVIGLGVYYIYNSKSAFATKIRVWLELD
jgi:hypothetical protein